MPEYEYDRIRKSFLSISFFAFLMLHSYTLFASSVSPSGIFNFSTIHADDVRDYDFVAGHTARVGWALLNPEEGVYDFALLDSLIERLQEVDQTLNLEIMIFNAPEWVLTNSQTWEHFSFETQPTPWDPVAMKAWADLMTAISTHEVMVMSQGGQMKPLSEHPTLVAVNASILGLSSFRDAGELALIEGYSRQLFLDAVISTISAGRLAFPHQAGFIGFFGMKDDGEDADFDNESLEDSVVRTLKESFNNEGQPTLGLFQELLSDDQPSVTSKIAIVKDELQTFIMFQALSPWTDPLSGKDEWVTSGNPSVGIEWGYTHYDATFYEIYSADLDAAINGEVDVEGTPLIDGLRHWAEVLATHEQPIIDTPEDAEIEQISYFSSVDNHELGAKLYIPDGYSVENDPTALVIYLDGGGGSGDISAEMQTELDARNWIGVSPEGREWGLFDMGCGWRNSVAYVDSIDPNVGPGEQDILDLISWAKENYSIDSNRIYLTGFSMGGRGTYIIGLKNPDIFAAIAPMAPAIDMYEVFTRRPDPVECKEGIVGGKPSDSEYVDTMYTITSGRFLIENAYNLPVYHAHGNLDTIANNDPLNADFLHGAHITTDNTWDGCFDEEQTLCFGHTPTLSELHERHPDGYPWAFMTTSVTHTVDQAWLAGTAVASDVEGVDSVSSPGNLMGIYEFFDMHELNSNPQTVVYKSYTDTHRTAYWLSIDIDQPWTDMPGAVRATRFNDLNELEVEVAGVAKVSIDMEKADLVVNDQNDLVVSLNVLNESVYDPALLLDATQETHLWLDGDFSSLASIAVEIDGEKISDENVSLTSTTIEIGPILIEGETTISIASVLSTLPIASAGEDKSVNENDLVSLDGTQSVAAEGLLTYEWMQLSGPEVDLISTVSSQISFTAPEVEQSTTIEFQLTVTDEMGLQDEDTVIIMINDIEAKGGGTGSISWFVPLLMFLALLNRCRYIKQMNLSRSMIGR